MEVGLALTRFAGVEERQAREAYDWLYLRYRGYVHFHLMKWLSGGRNDPEVRDEIVQNTFLNIWKARPKFVDQGEPQWRAFLKRTAYRCCIDFLRSEAGQNATLPLDLSIEAPQPPLPDEDAGRLYDCANTVLLELDPALSAAVHDRQLLAARFYYLDNESWENISRLLPPASPEEPALTRSVLFDWLSCPGVARYLAYDQLYFANDRLAAHLLGADEDWEPAQRNGMLTALMRRAIQAPATESAAGGWTWAEVQAILWRYRYGLSMEDILSLETCALSQEELFSLPARCEARFPFSYQMERLLVALQRTPSLEPQEVFSASLWQRLALQYHYYDEMTYEEIESRLQPAAALVNYPVRAATMPTWLSISAKNQGRVIKRLASRCAGMEGAYSDG